MTAYTNREVIERMLDVMRRADPEYVKAHGLEPCMDPQWDMAIQVAEDHLEEMDVGKIPEAPLPSEIAAKAYTDTMELVMNGLNQAAASGGFDIPKDPVA